VNYFDFFGSTCEYFLIDPIVTCMIQLALICLWGFNFKHFDSFSNSYISFLFLFSFFFFTTSLISSTSWSYHLLCPTVLLFASSVPRQIVYLFFRTCFFFFIFENEPHRLGFYLLDHVNQCSGISGALEGSSFQNHSLQRTHQAAYAKRES